MTVFEGIRARDTLFRKFRKSRQHTDNENFKRVRNRLQNLIKNKNEITLGPS